MAAPRAPRARAAAAAVFLLIGIAGGISPTARTAAARSCANEAELAAKLGSVAYLRGGDVHVVDLGTCRDRVVARNARPPVRLSADGRWVAFGAARIVATAGGKVLRPLPAASTGRSWAWQPGRALLAAVTERGGVMLGGPGRRPRRLLPDGWGAQAIRFARNGTLLISRSLGRRREVSVSAPPGWRPRLVYRVPPGQFSPPDLAGLSPDGRWLLTWPRPQRSNSLAADGLPLYASATAQSSRPVRLTSAMLAYDEFLSWCAGRLVFVDGFDRYATRGKRLRIVSLPASRSRELSRDDTLSWVSPACSPDGRLVAAAAGRNYVEPRFGRESRSIWLLAADGSSRRRLTTAPDVATSDEAPRFSRDGEVVLFWRTRADGRGALYGVRVDTGRIYGPLAHGGPTGNYYGRYSWHDASDWSPR